MLGQIWSGFYTAMCYIFEHLVFFNIVFAIIIIFFQRREPKTVWTWLLLLYFIPVMGFVLYLLIGTDMRKRKMFRMKEIEDKLGVVIRRQESRIRNEEYKKDTPDMECFSDLVMYNLDTTGAVVTDNNDIDIYVDGNAKFEALIEDIRNAKEFIHMQYYILKDDVLFQRIRKELLEKTAQGVEVRILFDAMGCRCVGREHWKGLEKEGVKIAEFFPAIFKRLHLRINYRNHRKIVVIDNKVGYVGGFNIGKEYIGLDTKIGYWRDTHLRICGEGVQGLALRFLLDWNYAAKENLFSSPKYMAGFQAGKRDMARMQIIYSGPDTSRQSVRDNYLSLINKAEKNIYIQTPYFIPDESMYSALMLAIHSGVEVNLMIPCKPDHLFVYWATYSYMGDLIMEGANCYIYTNGFLHAKGLICDNKAFCYGTANMDIRSFCLNFEVNATVYDEVKTREMIAQFHEDLKKCVQVSRQMYMERPIMIRFKEQISRLLSPLL